MSATDRITDILHAQGHVGEREDAEMIARVLVAELGLREISTTGYLDPIGFLHMGPGAGPSKSYVHYISDWLEP